MSSENIVENYDRLAEPYPGRVVMIGMDQTGKKLRLLTVISGRSPQSRNRIYVAEEKKFQDDGWLIKTAVADPTKPSGDPKKTIYTAQNSARTGLWPSYHVISNGAQTESILKWLNSNVNHRSLEEIQNDWETEGLDSDYTSRISAAIIDKGRLWITFGRIVRNPLDQSLSDRLTYQVKLQPGFAAYISTYIGDGTTTPQRGDPLYIPLEGYTLEDNVYRLSQHMSKPNLVAIAGRELVHSFGKITGQEIWNAYTKAG